MKTSQPYVAANIAIKVANPAVKELCYVEPWKPHSQIAQDAVKAFCDNIPTDPEELLKQIAAVDLIVATDIIIQSNNR